MLDASLIICMYNEASNIQYALTDILGQLDSTTNVELIVVDNDSVDDSYNLASNVLKKSKLPAGGARLFKIKHCSLSNSRNLAISKATGRYFSLLMLTLELMKTGGRK